MSSSAMPRNTALAVTAAVAVCASVKLSKKYLHGRKQDETDDTRENPMRNKKSALLFAAIVSLCESLVPGKLSRSLLNEESSDRSSSRNIILNKDQSTDTPASSKRRATLDQELDLIGDGLVVKPIGVVKSIYRLCVGTPRQGLLAPNARGRIELFLESDAALGLEQYSHIWIVFIFHLNTVSKNQNNKVTPPALGGEKVGVLATRSPHRPNPIGMTLCQLDSITLPTKYCKRTYLEISGLDLVDGTLVLDVKPYVPHYDSVGNPQLPPWVSNGLSTRRKVAFAKQAEQELETILKNDPNCLEFYGPHRQDTSVECTIENVKQCIEQVLGFDVRSTWQTGKVRKGNYKAQRADRMQDVRGNGSQPQDEELSSTQQLDNLLIRYAAVAPSQHERTTSHGSGAEDAVTVRSIQLLVPGESEELCAGQVSEDRALPINVQKETPVESEVMSSETSAEASRTDSRSESVRDVIVADHNVKDNGLNDISDEAISEKEEKVDTTGDTERIPTVETEHMNDSHSRQKPQTEDPSSNEEVFKRTFDVNEAELQVPLSPSRQGHEETLTEPASTPQRPTLGRSSDGNEADEHLSSPSVAALRKKLLENAGAAPVVSATDTGSSIPRPPQDADYKSLKSYWAEAASHNTPTGLLPEKQESYRRHSSQRFFKFSDKPVPIQSPSRSTPVTEEQGELSSGNNGPGNMAQNSENAAANTELDGDTPQGAKGSSTEKSQGAIVEVHGGGNTKGEDIEEENVEKEGAKATKEVLCEQEKLEKDPLPSVGDSTTDSKPPVEINNTAETNDGGPLLDSKTEPVANKEIVNVDIATADDKNEDAAMPAETQNADAVHAEKETDTMLCVEENTVETDAAANVRGEKGNVQEQGDGTASTKTEAKEEMDHKKVSQVKKSNDVNTAIPNEEGDQDAKEPRGGTQSTVAVSDVERQAVEVRVLENQLDNNDANPIVEDASKGCTPGTDQSTDAPSGALPDESLAETDEGAGDEATDKDNLAVAQSQDSDEKLASQAYQGESTHSRKKKRKKKGKKKH